MSHRMPAGSGGWEKQGKDPPVGTPKGAQAHEHLVLTLHAGSDLSPLKPKLVLICLQQLWQTKEWTSHLVPNQISPIAGLGPQH